MKRCGWTNDQIKKHPEVARMTGQLNNMMRARQPVKPKPMPTGGRPNLPPDLQQLRGQLEGVKAQLRAQGVKGEQLVNNPQVAQMQATLNSQVKARGLNAPRPRAPQQQLPPHVQAQKDQLRQFKDSLRARGIKGDQLVQHPQVKAMQSQLDQMMRDMSNRGRVMPGGNVGAYPRITSFARGPGVPASASFVQSRPRRGDANGHCSRCSRPSLPRRSCDASGCTIFIEFCAVRRAILSKFCTGRRAICARLCTGRPHGLPSAPCDAIHELFPSSWRIWCA